MDKFPEPKKQAAVLWVTVWIIIGIALLALSSLGDNGPHRPGIDFHD